MDRQTLEVVYEEIDNRVAVLRLRQEARPDRAELHNKIIELFLNLRDRLTDLEDEYLQQMADDYEVEQLRRDAEHQGEVIPASAVEDAFKDR